MKQITELSIEEMRKDLLAQELTPEELVKAHLEVIANTNEHYNSFITVMRDEALSAAKAAGERLSAEGLRSPPLTGIPVAIKDLLVTKGVRTTAGSKIISNFVPPYDCTAVSKLRQHGAIIIGKTNQDEFGMGSSNENSAYGDVRNPWDDSRVPGGSSGGSAVAVALGQAPASLGTDTGGSIRQPSSFSGVCGIKPTYGRVSRYGMISFASSLDQIGPFARSPEDLAHILGAISGWDPNDSTSMKIDVPNYAAELRESKLDGLKGLRVGVPRQYFIEGMDTEVEATIRASIKRLESLGAEIVDISLPHTECAVAAYYIIAPAEASSNLARYDGVRYGERKTGESLQQMYEKTRAEGFGREVRRRIMIGTYVLSAGYYDAYYRKAQEIRTLIINDFKAAFNNSCDVIACATSPTTAFKLGEKTDSPLQMYLADVFTIPASLAGIPGLSVPAGVDSKGLPIGLQLLAAPFNESLLLQVGKRFLDAGNFDATAKVWRKA
jgi:aspartyl-tRNA(Asn)/glutamyl-tRNA(Gln) amidotransferase subunit A